MGAGSTGAARGGKCYTWRMPTVLPRHTITETPDVKAWLDDASRAWPGDAANRAALLRRLLEVGHREIQAAADEAASRRRRVIEAASGTMPGVWPAGWHDDHKAEWPE